MKFFLAICLSAAATVPLSADLKYTTHMQIEKAATATDQPVNPMLGMMADAVMKQMVPGGEADVVYLVGDKGARIEYMQAAMGQSAGTITLFSPDGTLAFLNPNEKTYWKTTVQAALDGMKTAGIPTPEVTAKRTGQFDTVAGTKCEVITFDWKMNLPVPESARASLPPDFPMTLTMAGDSCTTTDQYQKYAAIVAKGANAMMSAMGFDKIAQGGLVLRQTMLLMGYQMKSTVTQIGEEAAPANAFEIPADYKEVPMPGAGK
jgi:uncharacterized protein DUF4412